MLTLFIHGPLADFVMSNKLQHTCSSLTHTHEAYCIRGLPWRLRQEGERVYIDVPTDLMCVTELNRSMAYIFVTMLTISPISWHKM